MNIIDKHTQNLLAAEPDILDLPGKIHWSYLAITATKIETLKKNRIPTDYPQFPDKNLFFLAVEINRGSSSTIHLLYNQIHLNKLRTIETEGDLEDDLLIFWRVQMPYNPEKLELEMLDLHQKNLQSDHPALLKAGEISCLSKHIPLSKIGYTSLDQIDFNAIPEGTNLAFCHQNENPVLYVTYNRTHLESIENWVSQGLYSFQDFAFYHIQIPPKVLFQHAKNLASSDPSPLFLGSFRDIPLTVQVTSAKYSCLKELYWKDKSFYLAYKFSSDVAGSLTLLYNRQQIANLSNFNFSYLTFYHVQMPDSVPIDIREQHQRNLESEYPQPLALGPESLLPDYIQIHPCPSPTLKEVANKNNYPFAFSFKKHHSCIYVIYDEEHYDRIVRDFQDLRQLAFYRVEIDTHPKKDLKDNFSDLFAVWDLDEEEPPIVDDVKMQTLIGYPKITVPLDFPPLAPSQTSKLRPLKIKEFQEWTQKPFETGPFNEDY